MQLSMIMDKFEGQFEDLDVQTSSMEGAISQTTAMSTPQEEVDLLMQQVADEAGLEIDVAMGTVPVKQKEEEVAKDELSERLAKLRNA